MPPRGTTISSIRMTWCSLGGGERRIPVTGAGGREKVTVSRVARGPKAKVAARRVPATRACDGSGRLMGNLKISMSSVEQDDERRSGDRRSGDRRGGRRQRSRGAPPAETRSGGFPCRWPLQTAPGGPARHAPKPRPTSRSSSHAESWRRDDHTAETRRQSEVWTRCALNSRSPRAGLPNGRAPRDHERRLVPDRRGEERPQGGGPVLGLGNGDSWCVAGSNGVVRLGR